MRKLKFYVMEFTTFSQVCILYARAVFNGYLLVRIEIDWHVTKIPIRWGW